MGDALRGWAESDSRLTVGESEYGGCGGRLEVACGERVAVDVPTLNQTEQVQVRFGRPRSAWMRTARSGLSQDPVRQSVLTYRVRTPFQQPGPGKRSGEYEDAPQPRPPRRLEGAGRGLAHHHQHRVAAKNSGLARAPRPGSPRRILGDEGQEICRGRGRDRVAEERRDGDTDGVVTDGHTPSRRPAQDSADRCARPPPSSPVQRQPARTRSRPDWPGTGSAADQPS